MSIQSVRWGSFTKGRRLAMRGDEGLTIIIIIHRKRTHKQRNWTGQTEGDEEETMMRKRLFHSYSGGAPVLHYFNTTRKLLHKLVDNVHWRPSVRSLAVFVAKWNCAIAVLMIVRLGLLDDGFWKWRFNFNFWLVWLVFFTWKIESLNVCKIII